MVDHPGPHPSHRAYQRYRCRPIDQAAYQRYQCRRIVQAASTRTPTKRLTSPHLPPTLLTSLYHVHRSPNKEPLGSIGLRVGIGRISMTIMTVGVRDVIECDLSLPGRSCHYPAKIYPPPPHCPKYSFCQHSRPFILLCIFIAAGRVTRIRALIRVKMSSALKGQMKTLRPDALSL